MTTDPSALPDFSGVARLFPLPNLVLFPGVAQPLHIFEARYRQLMADALAEDRLITMALLRPGWEEEYENAPPIHPIVCVGRIHGEQRLADGRYNLILQGLSRARIIEELDSDRLYRLARVELLEDIPVTDSDLDLSLRTELSTTVMPFFSLHPQIRQQLQELMQGAVPLSSLCDILSFALPIDMEDKQELLAEEDVEARIRRLLEYVEDLEPPQPPQPPATRNFPPPFSDN